MYNKYNIYKCLYSTYDQLYSLKLHIQTGACINVIILSIRTITLAQVTYKTM